MTLTKEWLLKTIAELEEERDVTPGAVNEDAAMALAAMKLALASLNAEPIYQCEFCHHDGNGELQWHWEDVNKAFYDQYDPERRGKRRILYASPPAPVAVPEGVASAIESLEQTLVDCNRYNYCFDAVKRVEDACSAAMLQGAEPISQHPELTVWYGSMPETNGKSNWTATLHRKGQHPWAGITIDCSEYPDRVRYEADRMRHLIGELTDEPDILAYDADAHSGYAEPLSQRDELPANVIDALEKALQAMSFMGDTLNALDAVCEEDVEYVTPAFEAVRQVLEGNSPAIPDGGEDEQ